MIEEIKSWWKRLTQNRTSEDDLSQDLIIPKKRNDNDEEVFVEKFIQYGGRFFYCEDKVSAVNEIRNIFLHEDKSAVVCFDEDLKKTLESLGISYRNTVHNDRSEIVFLKCEFLIAYDGSIMVSSTQTSKKKPHELPNKYIFYANPSQVINNISSALEKLNKKYDGAIPTNISSIKKDIQSVNKMCNPDDIYLVLVEKN